MDIVIVINDIESFELIISSITNVTENPVNLKFDDEGLKIQTMDDSKISLIFARLNKDFFSTYSLTNSITIGLDIKLFSKILKALKNEKGIRLSMANDSLLIDVLSGNNQKYKIVTLNLDCDEIEMIDLEYSFSLKLQHKEIKDIIKSMKLYTPDSCEFIYDNKVLYLSTITDLGSYNTELKQSDSIIDMINNMSLSGTNSPYFKISYSFGLFEKYVTANITDEFILHIDKVTPMKIEYDFEYGYVKYFLAPRFNEEDDDDMME